LFLTEENIMTLPDLILPQATDNVIQSADIALVGGVAVSILTNMDSRPGDLVCIYWDNGRRAAKVIIDANLDFPVVFLIPDELTAIGQHTVWYDYLDNYENIVSSNLITVTIK